MKLPEDELVLELLPEFVESWVDDMLVLFPKHLQEKNADEMYRLAHTLKGSCYQFGLDELGDLGIEVMALVKDNQWDKIATYQKPLTEKFEYINDYLAKNS